METLQSFHYSGYRHLLFRPATIAIFPVFRPEFEQFLLKLSFSFKYCLGAMKLLWLWDCHWDVIWLDNIRRKLDPSTILPKSELGECAHSPACCQRQLLQQASWMGQSWPESFWSQSIWSEYIIVILYHLHCLPICLQVQFKVLVVTFCRLHCLGSWYLEDGLLPQKVFLLLQLVFQQERSWLVSCHWQKYNCRKLKTGLPQSYCQGFGILLPGRLSLPIAAHI